MTQFLDGGFANLGNHCFNNWNYTMQKLDFGFALYTVNKKFISHEEFMNSVGKKLGLNEIEISIFLPE